MDGLSAVTSIISVIQLSSQVVKYISDASGATKDRIRLRNEVLSCESILQQLRDDADDLEEKWLETINSLETLSGPLDRLSITLGIIKTRLQPQQGFKKAFGALKWPLQENEMNKIICAIEREKNLLNLALTNDSRRLMQHIKRTAEDHSKKLTELIDTVEWSSKDNMIQFSDLKSSLVQIYGSQVHLSKDIEHIHYRQVDQKSADERKAILDWLTPIDYAPQQRDLINRRQAGSGQWLLDSQEYQTWLRTAKRTLFCPGIPGAGKTILTSIIVDDLNTRFHRNQDIGIAYIYCNFQRQDEQRTDSLLASLLKQLCQGRPCLPDNVKALYNHHKDKQRRPSIEEISSILESMMATYSRVFIVIDALDEYEGLDSCRTRFLAEIADLQTKTRSNTFATSRFIPEIVEQFKGSISLEICASREDVRQYVDSHIYRLPAFVRRNHELQEEIKNGIVQSVDGMFLLAQLYLDSLVGKRSARAIRVALAKLPTGSSAYNSAYQQAIERIKGQVKDQEELAKQVLSWIIYAKRPLTTFELQHALAVEAGMSVLDEENIPDIDDMVSVCTGLVTVDKERNVIRLVHHTMQEYFLQTQSHWLSNAEADITTVCTTYLSFGTFERGFCQTDGLFEERLRLNKLYSYAALNWGHHARAAPLGTSKSILGFLQNKDKVDGCSQAMMAVKDYRSHGYSQDIPRQMTGVHLAACFGLRDTILALLDNDNEPDPKDTFNRTPLSYAAERGYETVVALLLDKGNANPDFKDSVHGWTPLWYAVAEGHATVVKLLLEKSLADLNSMSRNGLTLLSLAAEKGHESVLKLLLGKDNVNPNCEDFEYGRTPLSWAAERGHKTVVEILLSKNGVDPDSKSKCGRTALWFARKRGQAAIVKLLLADSRVKPEQEYSECGQMPLWYAADMGQEERVRLLLKDGVEPDSISTYGWTPLLYAAERGHEVICKLLLKTGEVNPDSQDPEHGRTPLSWAAASGHEATVQLLLENDQIDPNSRSKNGLTPIAWAARFGREGVVNLLLTNETVDPDSKCDCGRTPLSYAAERGHEAVVRMLLKKDGVNLNSKDSEYGRTPLLWAALNNHHTIIELLLKKNDMVLE
ncbi:ankyrin repeat-containing domain protein [Annulohypoxylon moriforme]|nr:ankyrin repeat-containing domain protein [Annulohypoxylon moriforme]